MDNTSRDKNGMRTNRGTFNGYPGDVRKKTQKKNKKKKQQYFLFKTIPSEFSQRSIPFAQACYRNGNVGKPKHISISNKISYHSYTIFISDCTIAMINLKYGSCVGDVFAYGSNANVSQILSSTKRPMSYNKK